MSLSSEGSTLQRSGNFVGGFRDGYGVNGRGDVFDSKAVIGREFVDVM